MRSGCALVASALIACQRPERVVEGAAFASTWSVRWRGDLTGTEVEHAAAEVFDRIDRAASRWRPDSDVAPGARVVQPETLDLLQLSEAVTTVSGGAFDPMFRAPDQRYERTGNVLRTPAIIDLDGIAPGYAADQLATTLASLGAGEVLVEVGGELRAIGRWSVDVDWPEPGPPGTHPIATLTLHDRAAATSGTYRGGLIVDPVHRRVPGGTPDPASGADVRPVVRSATVLAPDAATADAWATALIVLGTDGLTRLPSGVDALLIDDALTPIATPGLRDWRWRR